MNLKQAARRLGIHYQTAYKLVRSGRLAAVCVGARYEISEAAIERYLAERQAMRRSPVRRRVSVSPDTAPVSFGSAATALDAIAVSATTVMELVADELVDMLGDLAVVRELSRDGQWFLPGVVRHRDAGRRSMIAATLVEHAIEVQGSRVLADVAIGTTVVKALVPQDCIRARIDNEAVQYFADEGIHSMIVAPAVVDDQVVGLVGVTRDEPGRPFGTADVEIVERAAALVGTGIVRARLTSESWTRRRSLADAVSNLIDTDTDSGGPAVPTVLGNGHIAELICDPRGRVVAANDAAVRLFDTPKPEIIGMRFRDLVSPEVREHHCALLDRLMHGELNHADALVRYGSGKELPTRLTVVRDPQARPRAIVVVANEHPNP